MAALLVFGVEKDGEAWVVLEAACHIIPISTNNFYNDMDKFS
jgi:hypothetical protein